jgi:hypothetical protein
MKYKTYCRAAIFAIIGMILLISVFLINYLCPGSTNIIVLIYINTASAVASIMLISGVWEVKSKRSFAEEVLELSEVSDSYIKSGITSVYKDFNDINWENFFKSAKKVTIFLTYGHSWRSRNRNALKMLKNRGVEMTVVLPNYKDSALIDALDKDFRYSCFSDDKSFSKASTSERIREAEKDFKALGATVLFYSSHIRSTYYFADDRCIFAPFKHGKEKLCVPAVLCQNGGSFFEFCKNDMDNILKDAKEMEE